MNRQQQLEQFSLALHRQAIAALRREPALRARACETLKRWRARAGESRSDPLWMEWERLLDAELPELEVAVLAESEHAALMRSVSPLGSLVDQHDRLVLLQRAREEARLQ